MEIEIPKLTETQVDVRTTIQPYGVECLLYKNARCDMEILDSVFGPTRWKRTHSRDNANCTVSVYDPELKEWVSKEDTGTASSTQSSKGLASDSFKRACVNWGIGRELYTAPEMIIPPDHLPTFRNENGRLYCDETFKVEELEYYPDQPDKIKTGVIKKVTIGIYSNGVKSEDIVFDKDNPVVVPKINPNKAVSTASVPPWNGASKPAAPVDIPFTSFSPVTPEQSKAAKPSSTDDTLEEMSDDEVILIGNCRGKKYGECKGTESFNKFLDWIRKTETRYPRDDMDVQFRKFKKMSLAG